MRTALCLGGGDTLHTDIAALRVKYDGVLACNEAGIEWPGELDAWVSLHSDKFGNWKQRRAAKGHPPAKLHVGHKAGDKVDLVTPEYMPGMPMSGSSGQFVAKVALFDLGFDRVVLCGIPLTQTPHFFGGEKWRSANGFRKAWTTLPMEYRNRMRSMSGWTRVLLGSPQDWA